MSWKALMCCRKLLMVTKDETLGIQHLHETSRSRVCAEFMGVFY